MSKRLKIGLIGSDVSKSISESIHAELAKEAGVQVGFSNLSVSADEFRSTVFNFFNRGGRGLSVTVPYKEEAYRLVNILDPRAKHAKSVNCIAEKNGALVGYNTDGEGFISDLLTKIPTIQDKRILILGAGGAARGIIAMLAVQKNCKVTVWARNSTIQAALENEFDLQRLSGTYDVVVHATSAQTLFSMAAVEGYWSKKAFMYDIQYKNNDNTTWFCTWARGRGLACCDGRGMVYKQAELAFRIWCG